MRCSSYRAFVGENVCELKSLFILTDKHVSLFTFFFRFCEIKIVLIVEKKNEKKSKNR